MADETSTGGGAMEQTLEQELEALLNPGAANASESDKGAPPAPDKAQPPAASPEAAPTTPEDGANPLLNALDAIEDGEPPAETDDKTKPAVNEEQQQILRIIPNAEAAANLSRIAENYTNFSTAFEQGRFEEVEGMFKSWNPAAYDTFLENLYAKHVASGEWVDRFIAEHEGGAGGAQINKSVRALEQRLAAMQAQLQEQTISKSKKQEEDAKQQAFVNYNQHVNTLLDQIKFSEADRPWIVSTLNSRVASNPDVLRQIRNGNPAAANKILKATVREYVQRDKAVTESKTAKVALQEQKKAPLGGGAAAPENALPDDIKQVPVGSEDSWMDQQLAKLARSVGLKK